MSLKSRLARLQTQAGVATAGSPIGSGSATASLHDRLARLPTARLQGQPSSPTNRLSGEALARAINGQWLAEGLIQVIEVLPLDCPLEQGALPKLAMLSRLPGESTAAPPVYIDTETTGLAGGSGTLAFLVGIARIEASQLVLTQFLITSFAAEPALLSALDAALPPGCRVVSYNGKSYDLPLLATRYRMHGWAPTITESPHLDLLHPVRRLFARRWSDCRLTTLERQLLGFFRRDDLPGSEAPEAWFSYLRHGDARQLIRVVAHNRHDILSLAVAHGRLVQAIHQPLAHGVDLYGLARWLSETNEQQALSLLRRHRSRLCADGLRLLAHLLRREENWAEALPIWERLSAAGCLEATERLAKYHEHIARDLQAAWRYASRLPGSAADRHRCARLRSKLDRARNLAPHSLFPETTNVVSNDQTRPDS